MSDIARFEKVIKNYDGKSVLKDLTFKVQSNSFTALIGNNGSGKSTIINILCNIIDYDSGQVIIYDKAIVPQYVSYKKRTGFVLSKPIFVPTFNTTEYLKFVCQFQHVPNNEVDSRIKEIIEFFEIQDFKIPIKNLSLGNQMKVSLAGALIHNPDFLILDEPFVNLDVGTTEILIKLLKSLYGKKTIFVTSHNLDLVADLCNIFLILKNGKIMLEIKKDEDKPIDLLKNEIKQSLGSSVRQNEISWLN